MFNRHTVYLCEVTTQYKTPHLRLFNSYYT